MAHAGGEAMARYVAVIDSVEGAARARAPRTKAMTSSLHLLAGPALGIRTSCKATASVGGL